MLLVTVFGEEVLSERVHDLAQRRGDDAEGRFKDALDLAVRYAAGEAPDDPFE